ncbi:hypothetical protein GGI07_004482 [Coemansia sp. Benny D115]|nr:hypothetical protein GGI07_004482 [Coemansia sp. Benny D115]
MDIAILEIGSNDAQAALADVANNRQTIYEFAQSLSDTVVQQLELLSEIGFKRIFVTNLPSLQHAPIVKSKNRAPLAEVAVSFYNRILAEKVMKWKAKAQLDSVTILDFESFVNNAIKPSVTNALGISDIESYCVGGKWLAMFEDQLEYAEILKFLLEFGNKNTCADSATKFFFDPIHPSERVHRLFGYYVHMVIAGQGTGTQFVLSEKSLLELIDKYKLDSKVSKPAAI